MRCRQRLNELPRSRAARYLLNLKMLIEQTKLITMNLLILPSLAFDIIRYHSFIAVTTNSVDVVSACPNVSTPKYFLNFRMSLEYFFSCNTFYQLHYILWTSHWNTLNQKMHMIFINPNFYKMYLVPFSYPYTYYFQTLRDSFRKYFSPVFCRTYDVV
jgi:hypothetical protein